MLVVSIWVIGDCRSSLSAVVDCCLCAVFGRRARPTPIEEFKFAYRNGIGINRAKKNKAKALRILIVDDQRRARQSLKALLATKFQSLEILEAANGLEAAHCTEEVQPQIVLMDARMPEMDGVEATRHIKAMAASTFVIVLSMYADYRAAAFAAGADEFVSKGEPSERLLEAVTAAIGTLDR